MLDDDQYFLLYFIMGTYFGPGLKGEKTQKSVLQRLAEGLPPYTLEQLAGSHIRTSEIEQIYYFLTRKAEKSIVVKVPVLQQFIEGNYPFETTGIYPQFPALFPPEFHPQNESLSWRKIISDIVFIRNPAISYIEQEVIERFKKLTGLEDLFISQKELDEKDIIPRDLPIKKYYRGRKKKRWLDEILEDGKPLEKESYELALHGTPKSRLTFEVQEGPGLVILPSLPKREVLDRVVGMAGNAYALTGSAALGRVGPAIGLMDIGESKDSYLFRVALPGVKREDRAFQCEVESDGKVVIKGETVTGEKSVDRFSQMFVMETQNMCPSGPFSVLFRLPGPVDPQQFTGSFGADAILEGVVMKQKQKQKPPSTVLPTT